MFKRYVLYSWLRKLMLRFVAVSIVIFLLIAAAIGASVMVGRQQSLPDAVQRFNLDGCASHCIMGITLGKTSYHDALSLFQERRNTVSFVKVDHLSPDTIVLRMLDPDGRVVANEITVVFAGGVADSVMVQGSYGPAHGTIPTLGDLVSMYGSPQCAQSNPPAGSSFGNITIINLRLGIKIVISGWYEMSWYTPVGSFSVFRYTDATAPVPCTCRKRWRGPQPSIHPSDAECVS